MSAGFVCPECGDTVNSFDYWTPAVEPERRCEARNGPHRRRTLSNLCDGCCCRLAGHDGRHRYSGQVEPRRIYDWWHEPCWDIAVSDGRIRVS